MAKERHALRNAIVPKYATNGTILKVDPNGTVMEKIRTACEIKQKMVQMKGMSDSEMLWGSFHGNEDAMQKAIAKGDLQVINGMYYWHRNMHEHITKHPKDASYPETCHKRKKKQATTTQAPYMEVINT